MTAAYGDSTADTAAAAAAPENANLADTAFRRAEKRYQLHYEQQMRNRKGRLRATGKLIEQPTDLSGVIDVRGSNFGAAAAAATDISVCVLQQPPPDADLPPGSSSSVRALVFRRHPGLVVFPAAVPAQLQLQLMHAALQEWPDPPARTNHTKAYGMMLSGLFQAAQQDLSLVAETPKRLPEQQQQQQQQQLPLLPLPEQLTQLQPQQQTQPQQFPAQQQFQPQHCQHRQPQPTLQPPDTAAANTHTRNSTEPPTPTTSSSSSNVCPWSPVGTGPKASHLLRKLRWVCLGPPYNWTERLYEPHLPHRPLPPFLVRLAQQYAQLAQQAAGDAPGCCGAADAGSVQQQPAAAAAATDASGCCGDARPDSQQQQPAAAADSTLPAAAAAAATTDAGSAQQQQQLDRVPKPYSQPDAKPYLPDAALVNYYQPGDTLNGHRDDVEPDLAQPIVTLSLGCDAVFLVGGTTR